jgi:hypothetical protein
MARMAIQPPTRHKVRILDPGAGAGILGYAAVERVVSLPTPPDRIELVAYETAPGFEESLKGSLEAARSWAKVRGVILTVDVRQTDFVMENAWAIETPGAPPTPKLLYEPPHRERLSSRMFLIFAAPTAGTRAGDDCIGP